MKLPESTRTPRRLLLALPVLVAVSWWLIDANDFDARGVGTGILALAFVLVILRLPGQEQAGAADGGSTVKRDVQELLRRAEDERQARLRAEAALEAQVLVPAE